MITKKKGEDDKNYGIVLFVNYIYKWIVEGAPENPLDEGGAQTRVCLIWGPPRGVIHFWPPLF